MKELNSLIRRDSKIFFKDRQMFFTSLITPIILLVLYVTFLGNVYRESFAGAIPEGFAIPDDLIDGTVAAQLISSLLAVSCVTVAFCSNLLMVQDKVTGARRDLAVTPVRQSLISLAYFISSAFVTLIISFATLTVCLVYLCFVGWYMSICDILLLILDVILLVLFGTALSSVVTCRFSTSGQGSAVGTIVSAGYGFICGAYMPISGFSEGLRNMLSFLPGTYGTSLLRFHCLRGAFDKMTECGFPPQVVDDISDSIDCNIYFFGTKVSHEAMYAILCGSILLLAVLYILINKKKKAK